MPTIKNQSLTLVTKNDDVTIKLKYDAEFSDLDAQLARLGLVFHEHVTVIDDDGTSGQNEILTASNAFLVNDDHFRFVLDPNKLGQTIHREPSPPVKVSRKVLDVDTGNDEIVCRVKIHAANLTPEFSDEVATSSEVLLGDVA